jgi:flagellin
MSGITLTAAVRQNLLSLQSTADLLSTTQNRLATGNKVNSALDNPTNFFTAQGLNNRAGDINNLLDGIGNGVQILQAANTGITSLQKLVDSAKSIANQALQATTGYSTKSQGVTAKIEGATASNLLGTGTLDATFEGNAATMTATAAFNSVNSTAGTQLATAGGNATGATLLSALTNAGGLANGDSFSVNGKTVTFGATGAATKDANGNVTIGLDQTLASLVTAIDGITGGTSNAASNGTGQLSLATGTAANLDLKNVGTGTTLAKLGLTTGVTNRTGGAETKPVLTGAAKLSGTDVAGAISTGFAAGDTLTVNGKSLTFVASGATGDQINITDDVTTLLGKISTMSGAAASINATTGKISLHTGTASDLTITSSNKAALKSLGLGEEVKQSRASVLDGKTLTIGTTGTGSQTTKITFGGADGVKTLDDLNTALAANNMTATIDKDGVLTFTTTNDFASYTIGAFGGDATDASVFGPMASAAPVKDANAQNTRASLVAQYNTVMDQIKTTAADSSFNGVNLLNGDTLALTFNETGKSKLSIQGVTFDTAGLGLESLNRGEAFLDNAAANDVLGKLNDASSKLRSQASAFGSNLSVVQMRQDFSKQMINVLQTGASNLTLADTNEEAANSQALSTRQSIAVSALSLANQSQQGVLQLLR